ncbi:hypothetical protein [Xanthomonas pisi]|nr:hypothetical protein [Xanthomonas pisi]
MTALALTRGKTYYRLTFADGDMTMPHVEPLVYIGDGEDASGERFCAFQDAVSYVTHGSRLAQGNRDQDDSPLYFISPLEIGESVVDLDQVAAQVQHCLSKAEALGWPVLPVLVRGWQSVES